MPGPRRPTPPLTIDRAQLDRAAAFIQRTYIRHNLAAAHAIGNYLRDAFFETPDALATATVGHPIIQALAERRGPGLTRWYLWSALVFVKQLDELPDEVTAVLPVSHYRVLHTVRDGALKLQLALQAARHRWTFEELTLQVRAVRTDRDPRGRPADPPVVAFVKKVARATRGFGVDDLDRAAFSGMSQEDRTTAARRLELQAQKLMRMAAVVRGDSVDLDPGPG